MYEGPSAPLPQTCSDLMTVDRYGGQNQVLTPCHAVNALLVGTCREATSYELICVPPSKP